MDTDTVKITLYRPSDFRFSTNKGKERMLLALFFYANTKVKSLGQGFRQKLSHRLGSRLGRTQLEEVVSIDELYSSIGDETRRILVFNLMLSGIKATLQEKDRHGHLGEEEVVPIF